MVLEIILTIFLFGGLLLIHTCFISPQKRIQKYKKAFEERGYKVFAF